MSTAEQLRSAQALFDGKRLTHARLSRGMTKKILAEHVKVTPAAIGQYEQGTSSPSVVVLGQLSLALGYPPSYFEYGRPQFEISHEECHFRRLRSTSKLERSVVLARAELLMELVDLLEKRNLRFPLVNIPDDLSSLDGSAVQIEEVAVEVRKRWGLGIGPIDNMVRLLESKGCIVTRLPSDSKCVDAFSTRMVKRPLVVLNSYKDDVERSRYDASHELGHLIFHHDAEPGSRVVEEQANRFGASFLMPAKAIKRELPKKLVWHKYIELKKRWKVSLAALVRRARDVSVISDATYKRAMVQYSSSGWRRGEPGSLFQAEQPTVISRALSLLERRYGIDQIQLSNDLCIYPTDLRLLASVQEVKALSVPAPEVEASTNSTSSLGYQ